MSQALIGAATFLVALTLFANFSIHKIEEGLKTTFL